MQTVKNIKNMKVLTPTGYKSFTGMRRQLKECFEIKCDTTSVSATSDHKVYTNLGVFKNVSELTLNDTLLTKDGFTKIIKITPLQKQYVYDLIDVQGDNAYYTNNILSHNCQFLDSGESSINNELYEKLTVYVKEPKYVMEDGCYNIWEEPSNDRIYVAGVDVAEGVDKDASVIQILDITDLTTIKQVACYHSNTISPVNFTNRLHEILLQWGKPLVAVERNNCGAQVVDGLRHIHGYDNIISWGASAIGRQKELLGIVSHTNTKYTGVINMRYWVNELEAVQIQDKNLLNEFKHFVRHSNAVWGAKKGAGYHDDRVMSLVWALIILEKSLVDKHFEILQFDANNRPLQIRQLDYGIKYYVDPSSFYNPGKDGVNSALPIILSDNYNPNDEMEMLRNQGFTPLQ
jgi:hypothetical protein